MSDFADRLRHDPDLYPHSYDPLADAVLIVEMTRASYEAASFLDQRALTPQMRAQWVAGQPIDATMAGVDRCDCGYIFHIGHVGSTLLARMMGAHAGLLSLREPATLRAMALLAPDLETAESAVAPEGFARRLASFVKLWSRSYAPTQRSVVKATSFASELAGSLLAFPQRGRSLAMYVKPEIYIAGILAGDNSRAEMKSLVQGRLRRLHRRLGGDAWRLHALSEGERIAVGWACEMATLESVPAGKLAWIDFERFLADPEAGLAGAFAAMGFAVDAAEVSAIATGPLLHRYSKGPEHAYTPELRRQVLDQARREHRDEIARGLAWLESGASRYPLIAKALAR